MVILVGGFREEFKCMRKRLSEDLRKLGRVYAMSCAGVLHAREWQRARELLSECRRKHLCRVCLIKGFCVGRFRRITSIKSSSAYVTVAKG